MSHKNKIENNILQVCAALGNVVSLGKIPDIWKLP